MSPEVKQLYDENESIRIVHYFYRNLKHPERFKENTSDIDFTGIDFTDFDTLKGIIRKEDEIYETIKRVYKHNPVNFYRVYMSKSNKENP